MPKIKITGLPKFQNGGKCLPGQVWDEVNQMCVPQSNDFMPDDSSNYNIEELSKSEPRSEYAARDMAKAKINASYSTPGPTLTCPKGYKKNKQGECVPEESLIETLGNTIHAGMVLGNAFVQEKENRKIERDFKRKMAQKRFSGLGYDPGKQYSMGHVETVSGIEYPSLMTPPNEGMFSNAFYGSQYGQLGGEFTGEERVPRTRIRILETPDALPEQMKYGGQSSYGLDLGWKIGYTDMAKTSSDHITGSMSEQKNPDEPYILEAEDNETLYKPGDKTLHRITGKRHNEGGVALTGSQVGSQSTDEPSFIYSDTKALKIKDPAVLKHFNITKYKRGGVTPAEISKKFDLNKFKAILEDPNKDLLAKTTAQLMMNKNEKKLAELATYQEQMKGVEPPPFAERKMANARLGGFIPKYQSAGSTPRKKKTKTKYGEDSREQATIFDADLLKEMADYDIITSKRLKAGDTKVPIKQGQRPTKLYGEITQSDIDDLKERHDWYFKDKPNWNPLNEKDFRDWQEAYNKYYKEKTGKDYFKGDKSYNKIDALPGEYSINAPRLNKKPTASVTIQTTEPPEEKPKEPRYICVPNQDGTTEIRETTGSNIGYSTREEAAKNCGNLPQRAPYDYLLPDKVNMFAQAAIFPEMILPFAPDVQFTPGQLNLEDWRAKAAQRFSTQYAAPAAQLAQFTGPQGLTANLSALAGQTAQQMAGEDIAPTISKNVDRANQFGQQELARQDVTNRFNVGQQMERYKGWATARQQYRNSLRKYLKDNSDAFTRAWNNRMTLGDINDSNFNFYKHHRTGRNYWYNPNTRGMAGLQGGQGRADLTSTYRKHYDALDYIKDEKVRAQQAGLLTREEMDATSDIDYNLPYDFHRRRGGRRSRSGYSAYDGYDYNSPFDFTSTGGDDDDKN